MSTECKLKWNARLATITAEFNLSFVRENPGYCDDIISKANKKMDQERAKGKVSNYHVEKADLIEFWKKAADRGNTQLNDNQPFQIVVAYACTLNIFSVKKDPKDHSSFGLEVTRSKAEIIKLDEEQFIFEAQAFLMTHGFKGTRSNSNWRSL